MISSLRGRLLFVVFAVALVAIAATAWATQVVTRNDLQDSFENNQASEQRIVEEVIAYANQNQSWTESQNLVDRLAANFDQRVALASIEGDVFADSKPKVDGKFQKAAPITFRFISASFAAFEMFETEGIGDGVFLDQAAMNCSVLPLEQMPFDLSQDELDQSTEALNLLEECLISPAVAVDEPAILLLGDATETNGSLFSKGPAPLLLIVVLVVLAISAFVAWLTFRRIVAPLERLSSAARAMGQGDFSTRVTPSGADELQTLTASFNTMASNIEDEDVRRKRYTSDIAHELRNPLANIRGYIESAQDGVTPINQELIDSLHEDTLVLQQLVEDLQVLTLAESGALTIALEPVVLAEVTDSLAAQYESRLAGMSVSFCYDVADTIEVVADSLRLRQVLSNLLANAARHTVNGQITLAATIDKQAQTVTILVSDTGEGIAPEHLAHVFDRFYRVDSSRNRQSGGSGLGLAICKELVAAQGGTISATSEPGQGSVFHVDLPART